MQQNMDLIEIEVEKISLNPFQMRTQFSIEEIEELKDSIKSVGLLQPPVVRKKGDIFELISGERRLRAVKDLRWTKVSCILVEMSQVDSALSCLVENVQRVDLNPLDVAFAYNQLMTNFSLTQEVLSQVLPIICVYFHCQNPFKRL
jgi:ParB family chromosome partitioning protein